MLTASDDEASSAPVVEDGLLRRRLDALREVIERDFDGETRPLALASVMARRYRWPRLRTLADVRVLRQLRADER